MYSWFLSPASKQALSPELCAPPHQQLAKMAGTGASTRGVLTVFERYQKERVAFVSAVAEMAKNPQVRGPRFRRSARPRPSRAWGPPERTRARPHARRT